MTPEHKRRALNSDTEEADMLSSLPGEVKDKILTLLPVKEAGRTGILSRQWRYTWSSIPELTIRDGSYCGLFTKLVDGILFLHQGPVYKFDLHTKNFHDSEPYDRWLLHLSRNGIRELILQLRFNYKIPSSLFSCQALTCLHLSNCTIKLPHDFEGFKLLRTVMLEKSAVSGNELEKMVSGSPLLESLFLWDFKECLILNIDAPNLKNLVVLGKFIDIQLWTPGLLNLWVELKVKPVGNHHRRGKLAQALGHIPAIEKLEMHKHFVAHLAYGPLLEKFPVKFDHLKEICFSIDLADLEAAALALSLFQNSPKLKILDIRVCFFFFIFPFTRNNLLKFGT
ncbi:F-box family protein [Rhynchospora pubera]|uniref:F-box family protein n=1 Tax=Rhynchospora pubera TaxID=906938 RepID=A0AAV8ETJ0_9POAL|nr:F-box family protein [Rhynchospora pubera]